MNEVCLIDKVCVPCRGGVAPLNDKEINTFLTQLEKDWLINEIGHYGLIKSKVLQKVILY